MKDCDLLVPEQPARQLCSPPFCTILRSRTLYSSFDDWTHSAEIDEDAQGVGGGIGRYGYLNSDRHSEQLSCRRRPRDGGTRMLRVSTRELDRQFTWSNTRG